MKIKSVTTSGFRRFSNLKIENLPPTAKLIVLAGPNGCGKSSLFDGFKLWHKAWADSGFTWDGSYYRKGGKNTDGYQQELVDITFHELPRPQVDKSTVSTTDRKKAFRIRSAYRNDAQFNLNELRPMGSSLDDQTFNMMIQNDVTVTNNYQRLVSDAFQNAFQNSDEKLTLKDFRIQTIGQIQDSIKRVFPTLELNELGNPLQNGTFRFDKGISKSFPYHNLSGGEKAAFDLLLDMIVKSKEFDDTVFCIDEPELHMNSRIQGALLEEIFNLVGEKSQLWISTHSIGMMKKARDLYLKNPQSVVFLDFHDLDFDESQVITPTKPTRAFWEKILNTALDDLSSLVVPNQIIICEGSSKGESKRNHDHDARCYNEIFADSKPDTKFITGGCANDITNDRLSLMSVIDSLASQIIVRRLVDRDQRSNEEIEDCIAEGITVLSKRHLESYLFADDVLKTYCNQLDRLENFDELIKLKEECIQKSIERGNPSDDIKSAAADIYTGMKKILNLTQSGSSYREFMRSTLSKVITPDLESYQELEKDVFFISE